MNWISAACLAGACASLPACSSYYKVVDPSSGKEYYTEAIDPTPNASAGFEVFDLSSGRTYAAPDTDRRAGAVSFVDASTGHRVSLPDSRITRIPGDVYREGAGAASAGR